MPAPITGVEDVLKNLHGISKLTYARLYFSMRDISKKLEKDAKEIHPWQDETGETRRTTEASISSFDSTHITVTLLSKTPQAVYLELARRGKWAWLWLTIMNNMDYIRRKLGEAAFASLSGGVDVTPLFPGRMTGYMKRQQRSLRLQVKNVKRRKRP